MIPPIADRFVAGETAGEALDYVERINSDGIKGILNLLGEHYSKRENADSDAAEYVAVVEGLESSHVDACVSVKPSQIGLDISEDVFVENLRRIVDAGDVFVWLDMEDHTTTDATLDAYRELADGSLGVCLQSNLRRTSDDLESLADVPGRVRLVKGAYDPPKSLAYTSKDAVDDAYRSDLEYAFEEMEARVAVGSHDLDMVRYADELADEYGRDFEVQMLMGVRSELQRELARDHELYQYVPYGGKWMSYFYRRVRERKQNLVFAMRAIVGG